MAELAEEVFSLLPFLFQTEHLHEDAFLLLRSLTEPLGDYKDDTMMYTKHVTDPLQAPC